MFSPVLMTVNMAGITRIDRSDLKNVVASLSNVVKALTDAYQHGDVDAYYIATQDGAHVASDVDYHLKSLINRLERERDQITSSFNYMKHDLEQLSRELSETSDNLHYRNKLQYKKDRLSEMVSRAGDRLGEINIIIGHLIETCSEEPLKLYNLFVKLDDRVASNEVLMRYDIIKRLNTLTSHLNHVCMDVADDLIDRLIIDLNELRELVDDATLYDVDPSFTTGGE